MAKYILQTRARDTLQTTMAAGASSATLASGNFGSPSGTQILTIDYDVAAKAADFSCTITGTAISSMTRLNGPDVEHAAGAKVAMCFVDEHYAALVNGTGFAEGAIPAEALSTSAILLGYAQITSSFSSTTFGTNVNVTGLSVTVTVPTTSTSRRLCIEVYSRAVLTSAVTGTAFDIYIKEGAAFLQTANFNQMGATYGQPLNMKVSLAGVSAGTHTYNVEFQSANAGTFEVRSGATAPAFIMVTLV